MTITHRLFSVLLATTLFGCGGGGGSGSSSAGGPPVQVTQATLSGLSPTQVNLDVRAGTVEAAVFSFANRGDAALTYELSSAEAYITVVNGSGSLAVDDNTTIDVEVTCSGADEVGSLVLTTNDPDAAQTNIPVNITCDATPIHAVARVVLNQAARAFDSDTDISPAIDIAAGRDLLVRAFVTGDPSIPAAEVVIVDGVGGETRYPMQSPTSVGAAPADESLLAASHYGVVPGSALTVGASLRVEVSSGGVAVMFPDSGNLDLGVVDPGVFNITFVPVTFNGDTPTIDGEQYLRQTRQMLPIGAYDIEIRAPYVFAGPYDLDDLLDEIQDLRNLDGSGRLYHAVIIPEMSGAQSAGLGYVGFPVSVSIDLSGSQNVISHEIGHNLDLTHAPGCAAPNTDPDYPYAEGAVTDWGFDIASQQLVEPTATKKDLMSYCDDVWVSDYHFDKALTHRVANPLGSSSQPGLLVSGRILAGQVQQLKLLPAPDEFSASGPEGAYRVVAYDRNGVQLGSVLTSAHEVGDSQSGSVSFSAALPGSLEEVHHVEIHHRGSLLHSQQIEVPEASVAAVARQVDGPRIQWQRRAGQALIIRDADGVVRSVDRTGDAPLTGLPQRLQIELISPGQPRQSQWVDTGVNRRIEWAQ